ncbi:MAG TPA: calcium-binding protein [Allosphingosinicella sp.]|nr:calcium-binding protein [Allosphingosinicella sp.]
MATFTGTAADEVIRPEMVSPTVATSGGSTPSAAVDTIHVGGGNDVADGGGGNDQLFLGAGNDIVEWDAGEGSDLIEGGADFDRLDAFVFNGELDFEISANGSRATFRSGVEFLDLNEVEDIFWQPGGSEAGTRAETIEVGNLDGTHIQRLSFNLSVAQLNPEPDQAADTVTLAAGDEADLITLAHSTPLGSLITVEGLGQTVEIFSGGETDRLTINGAGGIDIISGSTLPAASMLLTLNGGAANDFLTGGANGDTLNGDSGNDVLDGGAGADTLDGGANNDTVVGRFGGDTALLGEGADRFIWEVGHGSDIVEGQAGFDTLEFHGSIANENFEIAANGARTAVARSVSVLMDINDVELIDLYAADGSDAIVVGDLTGTDVAEVNVHLERVQGNPAGDEQIDSIRVSGSSAGDMITVHGFAASIGVEGLAAIVEIYNPEANDRLTVNGGGGNDVIRAATMTDALTINGEAGDDVLAGGAGADLLLGGVDEDTADYAASNRGVFVNLGTQSGFGGFAHGDSYGSIENAAGSAFADILVGSGGDNVLSGAAGNDQLFGEAGADRLIGGVGADLSNGGFGDDIHIVDHAGDVVAEGAGEGNDRVQAGLSYTLAGGAHVELMTTRDNAGTAAIDLTGNELANAINGNAGANVLSGQAGADKLTGLGGNDRLIGGAGADRSDGGAGNDVHGVDDAWDLVIERAGEGAADRVVASVSFALELNAEVEQIATDSVAGTAAIDLGGSNTANRITGNAGDNELAGRGAADILFGHAGNDVLNGGVGIDSSDGGAGDDLHFVDNAADLVVERAGDGSADRVLASASYILRAAAEVEILTTTSNGGIAAIDLTGNAFANRIVGNAGANELQGKGGADTLVGGGGDDVFRFVTAQDAGNGASRDLIEDFQGGGAAGGDSIDLSGIDAIAGGADNGFTLIGSDPFSAAGQLRIVFDEASNQTLLLGNTDGDLLAEFRIALTGDVSLAHVSDLVL